MPKETITLSPTQLNLLLYCDLACPGRGKADNCFPISGEKLIINNKTGAFAFTLPCKSDKSDLGVNFITFNPARLSSGILCVWAGKQGDEAGRTHMVAIENTGDGTLFVADVSNTPPRQNYSIVCATKDCVVDKRRKEGRPMADGCTEGIRDYGRKEKHGRQMIVIAERPCTSNGTPFAENTEVIAEFDPKRGLIVARRVEMK